MCHYFSYTEYCKLVSKYSKSMFLCHYIAGQLHHNYGGTKKRSLKFSTGSDINSKFIKVSWMAVTTFIILHFPGAVITIMTNFLTQPYSTLILVLLDCTYLIYYFNTVINPVIYYLTLQDLGKVTSYSYKANALKEGAVNQEIHVSHIHSSEIM